MKEYIKIEEVDEILDEMGIEVVDNIDEKDNSIQVYLLEDSVENKEKGMFKLEFYNNKIERYFQNYIELVKYLKEVLNENIEEKNLKEFLQEVQDDNSEVRNYFSLYYYIEKIVTSKNFDREYAWNGDITTTNRRKHLKEVFPDLDAESIDKLYKKWDEYISEFDEKECCVDSERIGRVDDEKSMEEYKKLKTCCGSDDTEFEINGIKFMFGCNYGH